MQKAVLKNFVILTEKQMWWCLAFNKAADLQAYNFTEKRWQYRVFLVSIAKLLRTPILKYNCKWSFLNFRKLFSNNLLDMYFLHLYHSD